MIAQPMPTIVKTASQRLGHQPRLRWHSQDRVFIALHSPVQGDKGQIEKGALPSVALALYGTG